LLAAVKTCAKIRLLSLDADSAAVRYLGSRLDHVGGVVLEINA
jgi:hypothetical protein